MHARPRGTRFFDSHAPSFYLDAKKSAAHNRERAAARLTTPPFDRGRDSSANDGTARAPATYGYDNIAESLAGDTSGTRTWSQVRELIHLLREYSGRLVCWAVVNCLPLSCLSLRGSACVPLLAALTPCARNEVNVAGIVARRLASGFQSLAAARFRMHVFLFGELAIRGLMGVGRIEGWYLDQDRKSVV